MDSIKISILDSLFTFPIVMIDGHNEDTKGDLAIKSDPDLIYGEAECAFYELQSISDRWLPTDESLENAYDGNFEACYVNFGQCGNYIVPLPKKEFKKRYDKFVSDMSKNSSDES